MLSANAAGPGERHSEQGQGSQQAVTAATIPGDGPSVFHRDLHLNDRARRAVGAPGNGQGGLGLAAPGDGQRTQGTRISTLSTPSSTFVSRSELKRAQRQGNATTILLLDLDHFKRINDTWGHPAGDAVLRHVATLASTTVRSTDLVGRLVGEEFIVLLPNTSARSRTQAGRKTAPAAGASVIEWEGTRIPVTASIGLSSTTAEEARLRPPLHRSRQGAVPRQTTRPQ